MVQSIAICCSRRMWIYFWIVAACGLKTSDGSTKRWLPDTDWQNRLNWRDGQLPCSASDVLLPEDAVVSIYVNGTVSWKTLVLPDNGELILEDDWRLLDRDDCQPGQAAFLNWRPRAWFHPHHWSTVGEDEAPLPSIQAVPHSDRIPCAKDVVLLPDRHGFSIDLMRPVRPLTVGALKFGQEVIRSAADLLVAPEFEFRIRNPPQSFYINGTDCADPLGCPCGNAGVMQLICSNAGALCADSLECPDAFRPPGHCCDMCGALFELTVDEQIFNKNALDRLVASMSGAGVSTYSYRSDRNILHLTVTDNSTNEQSLRLAAKIFDYLKDESTRRMYGIVRLQVKRSGVSHAPAQPWTSDQVQLLVSNSVTVLSMALLLALAAAVFYLSRGRSRGQLMDRLAAAVRRSANEQTVAFARFQNDGNVEIGIPEAILFQDPPCLAPSQSPADDQPAAADADAAEVVESAPESAPSKTGAAAEIESAESADAVKRPGPWKKLTRAFVNPLFGHPSASGRLSGRWSMSSLIKSSATQENPIYNVAGGQSVDDRAIITAAQSASDHVVEDDVHVEQGALEPPPPQQQQQPDADSAVPDAEPQVAGSPEEEAPRSAEVDVPAGGELKKAPLKPARQLATFWNKARRQVQTPESKECADESAARQPEDEIQLTLAEETHDEDCA